VVPCNARLYTRERARVEVIFWSEGSAPCARARAQWNDGDDMAAAKECRERTDSTTTLFPFL
jgi:hypothetical protein